jgi:hypothetical protein
MPENAKILIRLGNPALEPELGSAFRAHFSHSSHDSYPFTVPLDPGAVVGLTLAAMPHSATPGSTAPPIHSEQGGGPEPLAGRPIAYGILALVVLTVLTYLRVPQFGFLTYDDDVHVYRNPWVMGGLGWDAIKGAFTHIIEVQWIPLSWVSHMSLVSLFGLDPAWHHLANLALHACNAGLLFAALVVMSRRYWPSLAVSALFALHPMGVESVAWVSELKNVLSTFFWLLAMLFYGMGVRGSRRGEAGGGSGGGPGGLWLGLVTLSMGLGLLAKPMVVTLPFALLLLDYWPLERTKTWAALVWEKLPLLLLSALGSVATIWVGMSSKNLVGGQVLPLWWRLENGIAGYAGYLRKLFLPYDLCALYLIQPRFSVFCLGGSVVTLVGVSWWAWNRRRIAPYWLVGWLWFLGVLLPVSGVLQNGVQSMADRYVYLPQLGIFWAVVWGFAGLTPRLGRLATGILALLVVGTLSILTMRQVENWSDTVAVGEQAVRVDSSNMVAHLMAGGAWQLKGEFRQAIAHYRKACELRPSNSKYHFYLGNALALNGDYPGAKAELEKALQCDPSNATARSKLKEVALAMGQVH